MASRVNVKFVAILATVLVLFAGGAGYLAVTVVFKSAEDLARKGDAKMAEGDFEGARFNYSKAVNKDPYNAEYLLKWRDAISRVIPATDQEFSTEFRTNFMALHNQLALSDQMSHPEHQIEYAELRWVSGEWARFDRGLYENIADDCGRYIDLHRTVRPDDDSWLPLRSYRARALTRIATQGLELTADQRAKADEDLTAVLEADPSNFEALEAMLSLREQDAARARERNQTTRVQRLEEEFDELLRAFTERNDASTLPGAMAEMIVIQSSLNDARKQAVAELGTNAAPRLAEIAEAHRARVATVAESLGRLPADQISPSVIRRLLSLESQTDPRGGYPLSSALLDRAIEAAPKDAQLLMQRGQILVQKKEFEAADDALAAVASLPALPLGLEGMIQIQCQLQAAFERAESSIRAFAAAEPGPERDRWLARAQAARADLSKRVSDGSAQIKLLDAKLAYANGQLFDAQRLTDEFNVLTDNKTPEGLWLAADLARRLQQPGNSQAALEKLLQINPGDVNARLEMARLDLSLNRRDSALQHLYVIREAGSERPEILEMINDVEKQAGLREADTPVEQVIYEARRLASGDKNQIADMGRAIQRLRKGVADLGPHEALYHEMVRYQLMNQDFDEAGATVAEGLAAFPGDERLTEYSTALAAGSDVDAMRQIIENSGASEIEKQVQIYQLYARAGQTEKATAALNEIRAVDPDNLVLLELEFGRAFAAGNLAEVKRIAERAKTLNADRVEGLTYRARALLAEGKEAEARAALTEATRRDPNNASTWRILGNLQMQAGQQIDAYGSFQRALVIRPNDLNALMDYCRALAGSERYSEALEVARRAEPTHQADMRFMDMLLDLEARAGDKERARVRRENILRNTPDNLENRYALISLYIDLGSWDNAQQLIASTRTLGGEASSLVALEARWWAERNDIEKARNVFAKYVAEAPVAEREDRYIEMGQFMFTRGQSEMAIRAFRQGAFYEPEGSIRSRGLLGDALLMRGRDREASEVYKEILAQHGDPDGSITKRTAEALIRTNSFTEADRLLSSVPNADSDVTVVLLRADAQQQRGDTDRALEMLDGAVTKWPDDPRVWLKRAEVLATGDDQLAEALLDLDQVLEIKPISQALALKASVLARMGREPEALQALREAVRINPALDELRIRLIVEAMKTGQRQMAVDLANEWFKIRPRDVGLRSRVAELFVSGGMPDQAIRVLQDALLIEKLPQVVLRLADLLVGAEPPKLAEAERVFIDARDIVASSPALLMARARLYARQNRYDAAINDCNQSFNQIGRDPATMMFWLTTLRGVFSADQTRLMAYLESLASQPGGRGWASLFRVRVLMDNPATLSQGVSELQALLNATREGPVRYSCLRALAGHVYEKGEFERAVTLWKEALTLQAEDWQLENNIAYALASDLGRAEEALPFAEAAARHAPNSPETLDTLGTVYLMLGRPADALAPLESAVRASANTPNLPQYVVRLARARLESGESQGAADLVAQVESLLDRGMELDDHYRAILDDVRAKLSQG